MHSSDSWARTAGPASLCKLTARVPPMWSGQLQWDLEDWLTPDNSPKYRPIGEAEGDPGCIPVGACGGAPGLRGYHRWGGWGHVGSEILQPLLAGKLGSPGKKGMPVLPM